MPFFIKHLNKNVLETLKAGIKGDPKIIVTEILTLLNNEINVVQSLIVLGAPKICFARL